MPHSQKDTKSNWKIVQTCIINNPIHDHSLSWFGTDTSIKVMEITSFMDPYQRYDAVMHVISIVGGENVDPPYNWVEE